MMVGIWDMASGIWRDNIAPSQSFQPDEYKEPMKRTAKCITYFERALQLSGAVIAGSLRSAASAAGWQAKRVKGLRC